MFYAELYTKNIRTVALEELKNILENNFNMTKSTLQYFCYTQKNVLYKILIFFFFLIIFFGIGKINI